MKKNTSLREQLGIIQEDMALLLQVSRSQYSLYELGKRDLPVLDKFKLADLLKQTQNNKDTTAAKQTESNKKAEEQHKKKIVDNLLFINQRKQHQLNKTIITFKKKQYASKAALGLAKHLKNAASKTAKHEEQLANGIALKATIAMEKNNWQAQMELQLKKELLEVEENYLKSIFQKLG